jgi:hypothetical protein
LAWRFPDARYWRQFHARFAKGSPSIGRVFGSTVEDRLETGMRPDTIPMIRSPPQNIIQHSGPSHPISPPLEVFRENFTGQGGITAFMAKY